MSKDTRLVYSTDPRYGRCLTCGKLMTECKCKHDRPSKPAAEQDIRVRLDTKGRGGKAVTLLTGFQLSQSDLEKLLKELKNKCACGGTVSDEGNLELQGDHRDKCLAHILAKGFKAKKAGG